MVNYIVSGCPRSGTSMIMNILKEGGMVIADDGKKEKDEHNPKGYFEIEDIINKIKKNPEIIEVFENKVLKVTSFGIQYLPEGNYKLIYIERNFNEVIESMIKMNELNKENKQKRKEVFIKLNDEVKKNLRGRRDINSIFLNYNKLISSPEKEINKIISFLNIHPEKKSCMLGVIDTQLYRNRSKIREHESIKNDGKGGKIDDKESEYIIRGLKSLGYM